LGTCGKPIPSGDALNLASGGRRIIRNQQKGAKKREHTTVKGAPSRRPDQYVGG